MVSKGKRKGRSLLEDVKLPTSQDQKVKFSFEFYDLDRDDYCISTWNVDQIKKTLACLKEINGKTFNEIRASRRVYHFGEVVWERTTEPNGFSDSRINELQAFHFALLGVNGQLARVFGAYSKDTFYVVWFDLRHTIWPSALRNT